MTKSLSVDDKKKIAKFERNLRRIYSQLKRPDGTCDMPFHQFRKEIIALGDPSKLRSDMESIALQHKIQGAGGMLN